MTTPAHQHCAHECKCPDYFNGGDPSNPKVCSEKKCKHDTRKAAAIAEHDKRPRPPCEECVWKNSTFQPAKLACQFDLQAYSKGETFFEDIRACSGESCNYCGRYTSQHDEQVRKEERERLLKIAIGLIKHEGFLSLEYDNPLVMIPDVERCFDAIRLVDDKESLRRGERQ